jgi:hypothetical protein
MKWLTKCLCKHPVRTERPRAGTPQVEELEARRVLSASTFAVASGIINSPENFGDFVAGEYYSLLGRAPDRAGFDNWVSRMQNGLAPEAVEAGFVASAEYVQNHGNEPVAWLDGVYHDLLNRAPDISGLDSWMADLANGASSNDVALGIATSVERESMVVEQDYELFLGRNADPDGLAHWVNQMQQQGWTRADVATDIAASDEFFANSNNDPGQFIINLYQDALNRTPDQGEIDNWLAVYGE